ncbi:penicillin-binding transpeptidase domain-containing protein [Fictibacillus sp. 26RED30]|uniref:penicillin-binding transpeptidase domain-containing protein n=1 Tax=Fictibacillus sp. 26RED30 TaxID=2745877 RepID=UPI0018CFA5FD|nr:penicillin-binding transpeptidase domain-containing protein [Fictibacillus sp. 26RED30]MBH0161741.1 penicillin-binding transpeptidase domain-containing protein [Fictibacillus sp. 26RED30]
MKNIFKLILLTVLCVGLLSACSEPPKPENTLEKYVSYWEKQDFKNMYKLLDTKSQEAMSEKDFVERYESIYSGIEVSKLDVKMKKQKKEDNDNSESVNLPYTLKMETIGGPITFTQNMKLNLEEKKDTEEWGIQWNTSHIFPDMKKGDRVSASSISPKRGQILDSEGKALAVNGVAAEIIIVPEKLPQDKAKTLEPLSKILGMTTEEIQKQLDQPWVKQDQAVPIKKISVDDPKLKDTIALEGVDYQKKSTRLYPLKEAAAHLTGYIAPVSAEDMEKLQGKGYSAQDWIGKAGLEQVYEEQLRGKSGGIIKIMDSKGEEKSILAQTEVENGKDVKTTINSRVQLSIYNQIKADVGTSSAIHPKTGDVLALVNSPSYDPNQFTLGLTKTLRQKWADDPKQPMLNRFKYVYAPGSTLKPLTAAIGLENGTLNPNEEMKVSGKTWQKDKEAWGNYKVTRVTDVPSVNLEKALIYSDNIYFAQAALNLGEDKFTEGLKKFGFSEEVPVSFPFTASSIGKDGMSEGQLADSGFGQGQIQMSALHVAMSYTPFLNEGNLLAPRLDMSKESTVWKERVISSDTAKMINDDLVQVVANKNGTAHNDAFMKDLPLAGKTGTAELKTSLDDKNGKELGWFVGYNTQDPSLLVSMMIEDVKKRNGSHYVTPKVKNVFKENVK